MCTHGHDLTGDYQLSGQQDQGLRDWKASYSVLGIERAARLMLDRLDAAISLKDLAALPGNRFEVLKGDRKGQYTIHINDPMASVFRMAGEVAGTYQRGDGKPSLGKYLMRITAIHPGEHLAEELETLKMTAAELARELKAPTNRITAILNGWSFG